MFLAAGLCGTLAAGDLTVNFAEKEAKIVATCDKSTYTLRIGQSNDQFLMDKVIVQGRPQQKGHITAVFDGNVRFESYFHIIAHLDRVGYESLKVYILSGDKKSMTPFVMRSTGVSEPIIKQP